MIISSLKDLAPYLESNDYKERLIGEILELYYRTKRLESLLNKTDEERGFSFNCPIHLLETQLESMNGLYNILTIRVTLENIQLPDVEIKEA